ncbi:MAG: carotenoid 1,2-hydratase [Phenylobacterium sp.]|uniref:lipocalin-like domain-containing protein n=1 Tax=Phenylobacterium sp. TaxID=1871053 RepID=UPI0025E22986|nr:carotenoid 1,2-hydratase [Phenylobacterium sp.]MBA4011617.1 carotenoid 1,2-hydratase [Phenylobacterium sp.]
MRRWMLAFLALLVGWTVPAQAQAPRYPLVLPGVALRFPADHGAHPDFRTEWWYVTGWLRTEDAKDLGFQVTFFRSRPPAASDNPSAFAPRQVLFAHAAISDPMVGKLMHGQRIARAGFGLAQAAVGDADLVIDDWRLRRGADGRFTTKVAGEGFDLDLAFTPTQPVLLQGESGFSRKGPLATQASYYYSLPQLKVAGTVQRGGKAVKVAGTAWLDREWSSTLLDPAAVGWDWVGLNLDDGGALMAFQVRDASGKALWAGGSLRGPDGRAVRFGPSQVRFTSQRNWRSRRTGAVYPVERTVTVQAPGGARRWSLKPLFDDQELDSRASGGPVYWEGAVRSEGGRGYLELTGYASPMKL